MKISPRSDDYLDGKQEGLSEAAEILEQAIARGETVHTALFEMLEAANKVHVARAMEFDETILEREPECIVKCRELCLRADPDDPVQTGRLGFRQIDDFLERRDLELTILRLIAVRHRLLGAQLLDFGQREVANHANQARENSAVFLAVEFAEVHSS